jgi:hypothetical protein
MINQNQHKSEEENIYGDNGIGVTFRFHVTTIRDEKVVILGSQQS